MLASHRDPESYVAGATPLNREAPRYSGDIDVFHDREQRVASAALNDAKVLEAAGYRVAWLQQSPAIYTAEISREGGGTRLEWVADSDFRFFPTMRDEEIRRNSHYQSAEWRALVATEPLDPTAVTAELRAALDDAENFVGRTPTERLGLLFLQSGTAVQPHPARLETYETHGGQRRGHWPANSEITAEMFQRYKRDASKD